MEYPLAWLKVVGLLLIASGVMISLFYYQAARIAAAASAGAAATSVARFLTEAGADPLKPWRCEMDDDWWPQAEQLASSVAVGRVQSFGRVLPADVEIRLDEGCAVVVRVVARVEGVWAALSAGAVSCAETVQNVLTLPPPCRTLNVT